MTVAEDIFPFFSVVLAKSKTLLNFILVCVSYDANASMCNLKLIYPFIILYGVLCNMS